MTMSTMNHVFAKPAVAPRSASKSVPRESEVFAPATPTVVNLYSWVARTTRSGHVVVEGLKEFSRTVDQDGTEELMIWKSTRVVARYSPTRLGSLSGNVYVLNGTMDVGQAFSLGMSK